MSLIGAVKSFKVRDNVTVKFNKAASYNLNADSVRIRYDNIEVRPGFEADSSAVNQLDFKWLIGSFSTDGGVKTANEDAESVTASFKMPRSDVTVVAEYVYASTRLSNIEVKPEGGVWQGLYGFSPNMSMYDYVLPINVDSLDMRVTTSATEVAFAFDDTAVIAPGSGDIKARTIQNIGPNGVIVSITSSMADGATPREYTVRVKKFTSGKLSYKYTGNVQTFHPPVAGYYKFTAWGADGGNSSTWPQDAARWPDLIGGENGKTGRGGKASGVLYMDPEASAWQPTNEVNSITTAGAKLVYVYVGEGGTARTGNVPGKGAWNGGAPGGHGTVWGAGSGGGGATSVSLTRGSWSDWQGLLDRIMVAGGSGGYSVYPTTGGAGGGLRAQGGRVVSFEFSVINDYNPVTGYGPTYVENGFWTGASQHVGSGRGGQSFGVGGAPPTPIGGGSWGAEGRGGGGGGYFGGEINWGKTGYKSNAGGGGGSSYVSGNSGCISYGPRSAPNWMVPVGTENPLAARGDNVNLEQFKYHYSGYAFTNTSIPPVSNLWMPKQGPEDSPAEEPFTGTGPEGAANRHGILVIEYIGDTAPAS
jgi:hypothetical protein